MELATGFFSRAFGATMAMGLVLGTGGNVRADKPNEGGGGKPAYQPPSVPRPTVSKLRHLTKAMVPMAGRCNTKAAAKESRRVLRKMFKTAVGPLAGCLNTRGVDAPGVRKGTIDVWVRFSAELRKPPNVRLKGPIVGPRNQVGQCVQRYLHRYVVTRAMKKAKKKKTRPVAFGPCAVRTKYAYTLRPPPKPCKPGKGRRCPQGAPPRRR